MSYRITTIITISILFSSLLLAQISGDLNTASVSELDAVQLPSGTFIATTMEIVPGLGLGYRVLIHRSINNGIDWELRDSFEIENDYVAIGDPVLATDIYGNPHLLFMSQVVDNDFNIHLSMYTSDDDGENWQLLSRPYMGEEFADTPSLIIDDNNNFYISYTRFLNGNFLPSVTHFIKSEDGGLNWTDPTIFEFSESNGSLGSTIAFSNSNQINLVYNDYFSPITYYTSSADKGETWSDLIELQNTANLAVNKIVSGQNDDNLCVFTHQAHNPTSTIHLSNSQDNGLTWNTSLLLENSSMPEGYMDDNGYIHFTYNEIIEEIFTLNYMYSVNGGQSFSEPIVLYQDQIFEDPLPIELLTITGESQSMIQGLDNMIHMTFIDWSDETKAKHLIFEPFDFNSSVQDNADDMATINLFPNPTTDYVDISFPENLEFKKWSLHNLEGKTYNSGPIDAGQNATIDVKTLEKGTYLVRLYSKDLLIVKRIMVL